MANNRLTTNVARWNSAIANHNAGEAARAALNGHPQSHLRDEVFTLAAEAQCRVFRIPAPTLAAVRQKLESYWGELDSEAYGTNFKRLVLGDLVRTELVLAGVDWAEASGGMSLKEVTSNFDKAGREYDHYIDLQREGPSDKWGHSTASDVVALGDEAESKMLSLPAPNLAGVLKKLTAIWEDDRYDPIETTTAHVTILRDLRRLMIASSHSALC